MQLVSKTLIRRLAVFAAVTLTLAQTNAVTFRDVDSFIGADGKGRYVNALNPVQGTFSIVAPSEGNTVTIKSGYGTESGKTYSDIAGFRPLEDIAYNASAYFYVRDDRDSSTAEIINIKLDGIQFDKDYSYISSPLILGGNLWSVSAWLLIQLNVDGTLKYTVKAEGLASDFYLDYARLDVDAWIKGSGSHSVPDGGATLVLLGLGFAGMIFARSPKQA
jgi:hypothetical protein